MADFRASMHVDEGAEWSRFAGLGLDEGTLKEFIGAAPFNRKPGRHSAPVVPLPDALPLRPGARMSTQEAFGRILNELGKGESPLAERIVTTSPDVTVSTNLGGWVNQRGIFDRADREDVFRSEKVVSMQKWSLSRNGQHIELGIAENNPLPAARSARAERRLLRRAAAACGHGLRPVHRARPRCADLRLLSGRALPAGRHAVRHHAGTRRRRAPVGRHAAARHGPAGPHLLRAGLRRRGRRDHALGLRPTCRSPTAAPSTAASPPAPSTSPSAKSTRRSDMTSWRAATGWRTRRRTPRWRWSFPAPLRPRRRRPTQRWPTRYRASACSPSRPGDRLYGDLIAATEAPHAGRGGAADPRRSAARPPASRRSTRHRAGRPPGGALLARHRRRPPRLPARRHRLRRIRRYPGALRQAPDRHRRHPRHGRTRLRRPRPPPHLTQSQGAVESGGSTRSIMSSGCSPLSRPPAYTRTQSRRCWV